MPSLVYGPIPPSVPAVLAPPSRPSSPSSCSAFKASSTAFATTLVQLDRDRRRTGLLHTAPPGMGCARLLVTALKGQVGRSPPLPRAVDDLEEEEREWEAMGMVGLPRDEAQAEEWKRKKEKVRRRREKQRVREREAEAEEARRRAAAEEEERRKAAEREDSGSEEVEIVVASPAKPGGKARARASTSSSIARPQPSLTSAFSTSKSSVAAASASKKRPPTSPPAPSPARRTSSSSSLSGKERETAATSYGEESNGRSAGKGRSLGEDEEILFEGGCTQMDLPSPTPHRTSQRALSRNPSATHLHPSAHSPLPPQPFSSPGLNNPTGASRPVAISTPFLTRHPPAPRSPSPSPSRSRSPSPVAGAAALAKEAVGEERRKMHRLSSIARTESYCAGRSGLASRDGEGDESFSRFLKEDARD
ncbi:hypothetical protein JCM10213_007774 [Rhodosporidiobolus nylandii]